MAIPDSARLAAALAAEHPLNWVITGDSITHGLLHTHGARNYVDHLHELIRGDLARVRDAIINTGISGHRLSQILDDFQRRVANWQPDVVTLMIGTNDCSVNGPLPRVEPADFERALTHFVQRVRELGAIPVLQTPPAVNIARAPERARIGSFVDGVRAVAAREQVVLVDHYARYADMGNGDIPWVLMNDPFHPNALGHGAIALELGRGLGICPDPERSRVYADLQARVAEAPTNDGAQPMDDALTN